MMIKLINWLKKPLSHKIASVKVRLIKMIKALFLFAFRPIIRNLLKYETGREVIYKSYPKNSLLVSQKNDETYILNSSDLAIGLSTFKRKEAFEGLKFETALKLLPKGHIKHTFVDIGANIGNVGIHAVLKYSFKKCIAFEPDPSNYKLLQANIILNGVEKLFEKHNIALSNSSNDFLEFELSDDNYGDHRVKISNSNGKYNESQRTIIKVISDCLDNFSDDFTSDTTLIWMDTQGFEGYVLSGADSVLNKNIPIVMEIWPYGLKRSSSFDLLLNIFTKTNYKKMVDLDYPEVLMEFNVHNFNLIVNRLNKKALDASTDILIY